MTACDIDFASESMMPLATDEELTAHYRRQLEIDAWMDDNEDARQCAAIAETDRLDRPELPLTYKAKCLTP